MSRIIFHDIKFAYHLKQILLNNKIVVKNYIDTVFYEDIPFIKIDMNFKTREYLKSNLSIATKKDDLNEAENKYKPIKIQYNNKEYKADVRLKGLTNYHRTGNKKSLKIKLKQNETGLSQTIYGFSKFSIMAPERRWNEKEWLFREIAAKEGLLKKRYDFVKIKINSNSPRIYAIEEDFSKEFFEFNKIKLAPILSIDSDKLSGLSKFNDCCSHFLINDFNFSPVQSKENIYKSTNYNNQYTYAKNLLIDFMNKKENPEKIINFKKFAKFLALSDIFGGWHGTETFNLKLYFNPYTKLLEPIPDDMFDEPRNKPTRDFAIFKIRNTRGLSIFYQSLFDDLDFLKLYNFYLKKYSSKNFIQNSLNETKANLRKVKKTITKDNLYFKSTIEKDLKNNSKLIREFIKPKYPVEVFSVIQDNLDNLYLDVQNNFYFPITIKEIIINKKKFEVKETLNPKQISLNSIYERSFFEILKKPKRKNIKIPAKINIFNINDMRIIYSYAGLQETNSVTIPDINLSIINLPEANIYDFEDQIFIDEEKKKITLKNNYLRINKNLTMPKGYTFEVSSGSSIILEQEANLIIESNFLSNNKDPLEKINFVANGKNCILFYRNDKINIRNIEFENFSSCEVNGLFLTSGINFYETNIQIQGIFAGNNKTGDDLINIIKSKFNISNISLKNSLYDGLDIDYSEGIISEMKCLNCGLEIGGDALDLSHTDIFIEDLYIENSSDKGLSIGENSNVNIRNLEVVNSKICVANKDGSMTRIINVTLSGCNIGVAAYNKKSYYDYSKIDILNLILTNNKKNFSRDNKNKIILDQWEIIDPKTVDKNILKYIYE